MTWPSCGRRGKPIPIFKTMDLYFSDVFNVPEDVIESHGAFNVCLVVDLPLFVDPFLLFNSKNPVYQALHQKIIGYIVYLRDQAVADKPSSARLKHLYHFSEINQTWLGFSQSDNQGRGLGNKFAVALSSSLHSLFNDFGSEKVTLGSHLEKLCLIRAGVGRDMISDFTTNLIKRFLCEYTEEFARQHLQPAQCSKFAVKRVDFHEGTGVWSSATFILPKFGSDYVLLTPKDILTKDENWINKSDLYREYDDIPVAIGDAELRDRIDSYFLSVLPKKPTIREENEAKRKTIVRFPQIIDYFIRIKEDRGDDASNISAAKVKESESLYVRQFGQMVNELADQTEFYTEPLNSRDAALEKALHLKDLIENKGCHRLFYVDGKPLRRESDLQIAYRLLWHKGRYNVSREVNDGRGPVDFEVSNGAWDKTLVEMKLASNTQLERNLENQVEVYKKASDAKHAIKVIIFFTEGEAKRVTGVLNRLGIAKSPDIVLIDARDDNKPSGSKA